MSNDNSHLVAGKDGKLVAYVGTDAVSAVRAITLASALKLWAKTGMIPTRGWTITKMLQAASGITGKKYKRKEAIQAAEDCLKWANEMKAALPVERR
jgi:hypothetical protein